MTDEPHENCPYCDAEQPVLLERKPLGFAVACSNVFCRAQGGWFPSEAEAWAAWNKRDEMNRELRRLNVIDIYRVLKANRKRSYRDIAHLIAEKFGATP